MIKCIDVSKKFKSKELFNNFNLEIEAGEFLCIYGESGCGKSTLLNMIGSLEQVDDGEIIYEVDSTKYSCKKDYRKIRNKHVNFIFQNFALLQDKTVKDNLLFAMQEMKKSKEEKQKLIVSGLAEVGLTDRMDSYVYELSGGEQQRISLVRAFLKTGNIILADEPTGSLDEKNRDIIIDLLKLAHKEGNTIVVVTHDPIFRDISTKVLKL